MKEIYWIQRLDGLNTLFEIMIILGIVALVVLGLAVFIMWMDAYDETDCEIIEKPKRRLPLAIITLAVGALGTIFVPTTNEALMIFGIGGTIDYIQDNEKLQQLPDKCVEALDLWVESLTDENENEK